MAYETDHKGGTNPWGRWEEAVKIEKSKNKQLPLCLLQAKLRRAQKTELKAKNRMLTAKDN